MPGETPTTCIPANQPVYRPGSRKYGLDLFQPTCVLPTIRHPAEYTADQINGDAPYGRFEPRSILPVRALDHVPDPGEDKFRYHYGHVVLDSHGKASMMCASEPINTDVSHSVPGMRRNNQMHCYRLTEDDPNGVIPKGRFFWAGAINAPWWVDGHMASSRPRCELPV